MPGPSRSTPPEPQRPGFGSRRVELILIGAVSALVAAVAVFAMRSARSTGGGEAARQPESQAAAVAAATAAAQMPLPAVGLTDSEVVFGMPGPFSGANKEFGRSLKTGVEAAFGAVNAAGGVHGRKLRLVALDDGYEPERTRGVIRELVEERKVFGVMNAFGTAPAAVSIPFCMERKVLFYAPYTGAPLARKNPPDRYVFNFRPSYQEETAAAVRYLLSVRRVAPEEIAVFAQEDAFGDAGFQGVVAALAPYKRAESQILRVGHKRNSADVDEAFARLAREAPRLKAVVMMATYKAAARFVEKVRGAGLDLVLTNPSVVDAAQLADELVPLGAKFTSDVVVTQIVPLPTSHSTAVMKYREALAAYVPGEPPDFVSLEAYVGAAILVEGLRRAGRDLTTEKLVEALEGIQGLDLGIGTPLGFSKADHQASHKVWGTALEPSGKYRPIELD
ncbi:MAG TPA: ABC transporter substrate-binding protein [Anaeromyxobacteraceae bacterium]|jgi:ABC-type branched-subunit amino acid transport system substrate-binding protein